MKNNFNNKKEKGSDIIFFFIGVLFFGLIFILFVDKFIFDIYLPTLQDYHDLLATILFLPLVFAAYKIIRTTKK